MNYNVEQLILLVFPGKGFEDQITKQKFQREDITALSDIRSQGDEKAVS